MATETTIPVIQQCFDGKLIVLTLSLIITNGISILFFLRNRKADRDSRFNERLFKIQDISMNYPFLENQNFIDGWDEFKKKYKSNNIDYDNEETKRYLQYEQYCEMIFNFVSDVYSFNNKKESSLNSPIAFKSWIRTHKGWWINPLENHSNHDTYEKSLCEIIGNWIK